MGCKNGKEREDLAKKFGEAAGKGAVSAAQGSGRSRSSSSSSGTDSTRRHHRRRSRGRSRRSKRDKRRSDSSSSSASSASNISKADDKKTSAKSAEATKQTAEEKEAAKKERKTQKRAQRERETKALEEKNALQRELNKLPSDERALRKELLTSKNEAIALRADNEELQRKAQLAADEYKSNMDFTQGRCKQLELQVKDREHEITVLKKQVHEKDPTGGAAALTAALQDAAQWKKRAESSELEPQRLRAEKKTADADLATAKEKLASTAAQLEDALKRINATPAPAPAPAAASPQPPAPLVSAALQDELERRNAVCRQLIDFILQAGDMYSDDIRETVCLEAIQLAAGGNGGGGSGSEGAYIDDTVSESGRSAFGREREGSVISRLGRGEASSSNFGSPTNGGAPGPVVSFNGYGFGDSMAYLAANILRQNPLVSEVDLSECNLTDAGLGVIAVTMNLCENNLHGVNIASNERITYRGVFIMIRAVLKSVDELHLRGRNPNAWTFLLGLKGNDHIWDQMRPDEEAALAELVQGIVARAPKVRIDLPLKPMKRAQRVFDDAAPTPRQSQWRFAADAL